MYQLKERGDQICIHDHTTTKPYKSKYKPASQFVLNLNLNLNPHDPQSDFIVVMLAAIMGMCVCLTWGKQGPMV